MSFVNPMSRNNRRKCAKYFLTRIVENFVNPPVKVQHGWVRRSGGAESVDVCE